MKAVDFEGQLPPKSSHLDDFNFAYTPENNHQVARLIKGVDTQENLNENMTLIDLFKSNQSVKEANIKNFKVTSNQDVKSTAQNQS